MKRRTLLAGTAALAAAPRLARAEAATKVVFWHAMTGALGEQVTKQVDGFNASQADVEVQAVFKGTYPETLTAAIAAWRANQAPHLVQMFEVGTGSMLGAGPAVKQVWQLAEETGVAIDPKAYIGAIRGYYSLADGRMASMPFNSSTAVMWYNKDAFEKAGLDPAAPPATWPAVVDALGTLASKAPTPVAMTSAWLVWIQFEQFGALHNLPYATRANGFEGLDTELKINAAPYVAQLQRFLDMAKAGLFKYAGRDSAADPVFYSGEAAVSFNSSGSRGDIARNAKFGWAAADLPYDPALIAKPLNSIIGGASLWTMTAPGRTPAEYKGVAQFLQYLGQPRQAADWSEATGYVPVTFAGYETMKTDGFFDKNPGADLPILQLTREPVTDNSRGFRLGRMAELRNIIYEEVETALQGKQSAQTALDSAVARGNKVLRDFEKSMRT